jgi:hypothetical protein
MDQWNEYLDRELSVFKKDEKYDYVKDMNDAFADGLKTSLAAKILNTIPAHVFWDIKTPINMEQPSLMNQYNPARKVFNDNFFDIRTDEAWLKERKVNMLLKPSVSKFRNY